ncbi:hypothetical protein C8R47DRAFT_1323872 [Mycena vitilis]|nr:hypothetical protein C8R47DRAFT_1323872 [Mycena vitilis]
MVALNPRFLVLLGLCVVASSNAMTVHPAGPFPPADVGLLLSVSPLLILLVQVPVSRRSAPTPAVAVDPRVSLSHNPRSAPSPPVSLPIAVDSPAGAPHGARGIPQPPLAPKAPVDPPHLKRAAPKVPQAPAVPALPVELPPPPVGPRSNPAPAAPDAAAKVLAALPLPTNANPKRAFPVDHAPEVSQNVSQRMVKRVGPAPPPAPPGVPSAPSLPLPPSLPALPHKRANPDPQPLEHPAIDRSYARRQLGGLLGDSRPMAHMYEDENKKDLVIGRAMEPVDVHAYNDKTKHDVVVSRKHGGGGGGGAPDPAPANPAAADPPTQAQPADPAAQQQTAPQINVVGRAAHINDAVIGNPTSPKDQVAHVNNQRRKHGAPDPPTAADPAAPADPAAGQQPGVTITGRATNDEVVSAAGSPVVHGHQTSEKRGH